MMSNWTEYYYAHVTQYILATNTGQLNIFHW
jgi:hypothetical protein